MPFARQGGGKIAPIRVHGRIQEWGKKKNRTHKRHIQETAGAHEGIILTPVGRNGKNYVQMFAFPDKKG